MCVMDVNAAKFKYENFHVALGSSICSISGLGSGGLCRTYAHCSVNYMHWQLCAHETVLLFVSHMQVASLST